MFSSDKMTWETPPDLYRWLDVQFGFTLDVCAESETAKSYVYFTPEDNALDLEWDGICFMNPPYGRQIKRWVAKAHAEGLRGSTVVCLVPARVDTRWWWDHCRFGEVWFLPGRVKFWIGGKEGDAAPFPSAVVVFGPEAVGGTTRYREWKK